MDLKELQRAVKTGPGVLRRAVEAIRQQRDVVRALRSFLEAARLLGVSWQDQDPGKHAAHWYAFKNGRKAWPRELVEPACDREPDSASLCAFAELDRKPCPACEAPGLDVCSYQQTEDKPTGDTWTKTRYVMCVDCRVLHRIGQEQSSGRF